MTIDSRVLGILSALPYISLGNTWTIVSIMPIGIAWDLSPLVP